MTYETFIFDLDGTLLDTLADLAAAVNYALEKNGYPPRREDEVQAFIGNGVVKLMERAIGQPKENTVNFEQTFLDFKRYYGENCMVHTKLYDGIEEVLSAIKAKGKRCAIVSNKADFAVQILNDFYFKGLIGVAVGENEGAGIRKKPAPDSVILALQLLDATCEGAVYIGDSEVDIQTAKNAGLPCISVSWGMKTREFLQSHGAETVLDEPLQLLQFV